MSNGHETTLIVRRCCLGEPEALARLRNGYHDPLRNVLLARGASVTEAEDLLADLWADCVPGSEDKPTLLDRFNGRSSLRGWLATVLTNRWIDRKRKEQRLVELSPDEESELGDDPSPAGSPLVRDESLVELLHTSIREAFAQCPADALLMLRLVYEHGLTQREVCRMGGWSEAKVSRLLSETMAQIQKDVLKALRMRDPWLELSWEDLVAVCEVYQDGLFQAGS